MAKAKTQNLKEKKTQKTEQVSNVKKSEKSKKTTKSEPIVVAQIMGKWLGGGVESVIMNYYRHIDRSKIQFDFICDEDSTNIPYDEIEKLGGKVILCPPYQKLPKYLKFLKQLFREKKYRIVHSNINTLSVFPLYAAKKAGVPVRIAHSHSTSNPREWKKNLMKNALRPFSKVWATDYFACSELAGRYLFGDKAFDKGEVKIIRNAIDVEKFKFDPGARKRLRKEFGFKDSDYVIGNFGRLVSAKNQLFLIDAFAEFKKKNPNAKLLIVGEGDLRDKLEEKIASYGLSDDVRIEGFRKDLNKCYSALDLFAFPSIYEGLGMVAVEAQVNGLNVLASEFVSEEANIGLMTRGSIGDCCDGFLRKIKRGNWSEVDIEKYNIANNIVRLEEQYITQGSIKLLFTGMTPMHGGIETYVNNYSINLTESGFKVFFVNDYSEDFYYQKEFEKRGMKVFKVPSYRKRPISYIFSLIKVINDNRIDIVHCNMNSAVFLFPLIAGRLSKAKRVIAHAHNSSSDKGFLKELLHRINRRFIPLFATDLFSCSKTSEAWFFPHGNSIVIPNAIDVDRFTFDPEARCLLRRSFGIMDNDVVIGHVGRFNRQKNHQFLIKMLGELNKSNKRYKLLLVGDGPLVKEIKQSVLESRLEKEVVFAGTRNDVNKLYSAMDLFVLPSLYEGLPLAGIEAQASSVPCILSDSITKEVSITDLVDFAKLDTTIWCEIIANRRIESTRGARKEMMSFDIKNATNRIINLYRGMINE